MTLIYAIQKPAESHAMKVGMESEFRAIIKQSEGYGDHPSDHTDGGEV